MTSVFEHQSLSGVFDDSEVSAHLAAHTQLQHMLSVEAAHRRILSNEAAAFAVVAAQVTPQVSMVVALINGLPVSELVQCLRAQITIKN